jgi:hypothetical protein
MATMEENLIALNEAKANIKSAIESKGQDLTNVPFTQYADKINAISGGGNDDTLKGLIDGTLTELTIPSGVKTIGRNAFYNRSNLKKVTLSSTVEKIEQSAFQSTGLTSVVLNENLKQIDYGAFWYCSKLLTITFPDSVTTLGDYICSNCSALTSAIIGKGISIITANLFSSCKNLLKVVFSSELTAVPTLKNTSAFANTHADLKIYVPDALYDTWVGSTNWTTYASKIVKLSEMPAE